MYIYNEGRGMELMAEFTKERDGWMGCCCCGDKLQGFDFGGGE